MEIVSGRTGKPHVTSQQFRQIIEGTVGQGSYIITSGENLEPELASNNLLKIRSGMMCHHGNVSCVKIGTYDEVELTNGSQGMKRIDLVVNRYTRNEETGVESNEWVVLMGKPDAKVTSAPSYTVGNLQDGDLVDDCPVFAVHFDGISITDVKSLLPIVKSASALQSELANIKVSTIQYPITLTYNEHISGYLGWIQIPAADLAKYGRIVGASFHASSAVPGNTSWYYSGSVAYVYGSSVDAAGKLYVTFLMEPQEG